MMAIPAHSSGIVHALDGSQVLPRGSSSTPLGSRDKRGADVA
jgi:hypothetical protein